MIFVSDNKTEMFIALGRMDKNGDFTTTTFMIIREISFPKLG